MPEIASRKHVEAIAGLTELALEQAGLTRADIDAVAVTYAPGLIGALLVGVNFAKSAAYALGVPLIPVHHTRGHIAANYITHPELEPPFVCLCVSGGNTMIVDVQDYTRMRILGATRDDAAVSASTRWPGCWASATPAGLPWIGWPRAGTTPAMSCPGPTWPEPPWTCPSPGSRPRCSIWCTTPGRRGIDISYSGLAASFAAAVSDTLVPRTMEAAKQLGYGKVAVAGGVGGQHPHPGGLGAGLPPERRQALPAPAVPVRGQRGHDRLPGLL